MVRTTRLLGPFDRLGILLLAAVLAALLVPPLVPYEPAWEFAAGLGYAACCATILCFRLVPPPRGSRRLALHRVAGNAALALVAAHVAVVLAADPFVLDYLGWMMPLHVLAGVLAAAAMLLAALTREPLVRLPARLRGGRRLHAWAGVAAGVLVAAHAVSSSTKLTASWRAALLASAFVVLLAPAVERLALGRRSVPVRYDADLPRRPVASDARYLLTALAALLALLVAVPALLPYLRG